MGSKHLGLIKKALTLGSKSVNILLRGAVAVLRVVKCHFKTTSIVFLLYLQQFVSTPLPILCASKVATELRIHNFTIVRTIIIFVISFRQILILKMQ